MSDPPDQDERTLSELSKRMLSTPPKRHDEMKIGKHKAKDGANASRKPAVKKPAA
jgi:hypothetical protein